MPAIPVPLEIKTGFAPDIPDLGNPASPNARNVIARTTKSFGPYPSPVLFSASALVARCQGAASFLDGGGNIYQFAGDATDLYEFKNLAWAKVSIAGGYTAPGTQQWYFQFYNGFVYATDFTDAIQTFTLGSSSAFAVLASAAPNARYLGIVKGFLVAVNTNDSTFGLNPWRVWWSKAGDPTAWPTPGTATAAIALSSYNDLEGNGGWNQGIAAGLTNADAVIFQEHALWTMNFSGVPNAFDFRQVEGAKGCPAPGSIIVVSNTAFYLGEDGFYSFDGAASAPIGTDMVDHYFWNDVDQTNLARVCVAVDVLNRMIMWAYPDKTANGTPNHILCYRWDIGRWTILDITLEIMTRLVTTGYTLDQLYTILGYTLDNLPAPLDSRSWTGGIVSLGMFGTGHQLSYFTGPNLAATVDSGEREIFPGQVAEIAGECRPMVDGGTPSIAIGRRNRLQDVVKFANAVPMNSRGICPQRTSGRYVRARITMPAGAVWNNLWGATLQAVPGGER